MGGIVLVPTIRANSSALVACQIPHGNLVTDAVHHPRDLVIVTSEATPVCCIPLLFQRPCPANVSNGALMLCLTRLTRHLARGTGYGLLQLADDVLSLDSENADARTFLSAAEKNLGTLTASMPSPAANPAPTLPASFAGHRLRACAKAWRRESPANWPGSLARLPIDRSSRRGPPLHRRRLRACARPLRRSRAARCPCGSHNGSGRCGCARGAWP